MGFTVVEGSPRSVWVPIVDSDTIYIGQIVACQANEGIVPIGAAAGAADTTGKEVPYGVVVGLNAYVPSFDTTQKAEKITDATPHGTTTDYRMVEGPMMVDGHYSAMAEVKIITPHTVLQGPICNAALGTAPTVGTVTTGSTAGTAATGAAALCDVAGVADISTAYFRSGSNTGSYRVTDDTSTTALTWDKPTYADVAANDTLVRVNGLRPVGPSYMQLDTEAMYIDCSAALTADYYVINVIKLDLSEAGKEHVIFMFGADHFALKRT